MFMDGLRCRTKRATLVRGLSSITSILSLGGHPRVANRRAARVRTTVLLSTTISISTVLTRTAHRPDLYQESRSLHRRLYRIPRHTYGRSEKKLRARNHFFPFIASFSTAHSHPPQWGMIARVAPARGSLLTLRKIEKNQGETSQNCNRRTAECRYSSASVCHIMNQYQGKSYTSTGPLPGVSIATPYAVPNSSSHVWPQ